MKIGTITYHKAYNFGSALQAYALNKYLTDQGFDVEIINYHTSGQDSLYQFFEPITSVMSLARNVHALLFYNSLKVHRKKFDEFLKEYIHLSEKEYDEYSELSTLNDIYQYFICGSDQIWNPNCADFTKAYLLDFVKDKSKCISYAASIGVQCLPKEYEEVYKNLLMNFRDLSVREEEARLEIEALTKRQVSVVPDPVLLLSLEDWDKVAAERLLQGKYIFCYFIGDVKGMRKFAVRMSKQMKMPLVVVNRNLRDFKYKNKKMYFAGPREFLSLLKNSEYICTNSFHAVMFSLIYEKDFWVFVDSLEGNASSRITHILKRFGLADRILTDDCPMDVSRSVNFEGVSEGLKAFAEIGKEFLKFNLKDIQ